MSVEALSEMIFIDEADSLERLAESLCQEQIVAVDTESNSLFAYREQVCLIQFSTPAADYLVDPLALGDLSPLSELFACPDIEKVFHAAEYDLLCLKRDFGFKFASLFDTMVAARILGRQAVGLGSILQAEFGLQLDKRHQRANWGQRPLPTYLLEYARLDTHYLIPLWDRLRKDLQEQGLWMLACEDFNRIGIASGQATEEKSLLCWRISGSYDLTPQQAAVLMELCCYRDRSARSHNRPLFKIMGDRTLLAIAHAAPDNLHELSLLPGMSQNQLHRHGIQLLEAVQRGLHAKPVFPPRTHRPSEQFLDRLERLRLWRKQAGLNMGVSSDVVLPRDLLYSLAELNPRTPQELAEVMNDVPWRLEHFGDQLLQVLNKKH